MKDPVVGSIVAGITSFSFLEGLDTTSPGGWWWRAAGDLENKANSAAGAKLSLAKTPKRWMNKILQESLIFLFFGGGRGNEQCIHWAITQTWTALS